MEQASAAPGSLHHLELWVADLPAAEPAWRWLLTTLGYREAARWPHGVSYARAGAYVVLESGPDVTGTVHDRTRPGLNHLALRATQDDVDAVAAQGAAHGWTLLFPDRHPHAGGPDHYAAYLEDAAGFEVELVAADPLPLLVVVSGLPGVGKTRVAAAVASVLGAAHLSVDAVEEALLGAGLPPGWTTGVAAYEAVAAASRTTLAAGGAVVVDAVNDSEPARSTWDPRDVPHRTRHVVLAVADAAEHRRRLEGRTRPFRHVPEPTWQAVLDRQVEPWTRDHALVDAGRPLDAVVADVLAAVAG